MPDLDDAGLLQVERESRDEAVVLLKEVWGLTQRPRLDGHNVMRLGYGRRSSCVTRVSRWRPWS